MKPPSGPNPNPLRNVQLFAPPGGPVQLQVGVVLRDVQLFAPPGGPVHLQVRTGDGIRPGHTIPDVAGDGAPHFTKGMLSELELS